MREKNFTELLSGIQRDESGRIVGAQATFITWLTDMNMTEALENPVPNRPEPINQRAFEFEGKMLDILMNQSYYPIGNADFLFINLHSIFFYLIDSLGT